MATDWQKIEGLFHIGRQLDSAELLAFLAAECGDDSDLRREVEGLLEADRADTALPGNFVAAPGVSTNQLFDQYRILMRCGQGATGTVYRAHDSVSGQDVAIKIFPPFPSPQQRRRYLKEAKATASLRHPYIASVQRIGKTGDRDYLVMDFVERRTLGEALPKSGLPLRRAHELAHMLLDGPATAHRAGIIHRDLRPSNIMIDSAGSVKILDFGLAKMIDGATDSPAATASHRDAQMTPSLKTATGQILGTACYLSPEQAEGLP